MNRKPKKWNDLDIDDKITAGVSSIIAISLLIFAIAIVAGIFTGTFTSETESPQTTPQHQFCKALTAENMSCDWSSEELPVLGLYYMNTYDMTAVDAMHKSIKTLKGEK